MEYIDNDSTYIKIEHDSNGEYFYCHNCGKKIYLDDVEHTDKWWDDEGNHRMIYTCPKCEYDNYEE